MEIIIAKNAGLCYGVQRALTLARKVRKSSEGRVLTFGDLIHNPQVIDDLKRQGIESADALGRLDRGTVIIRSHGVSPDVYEKMKSKNISIVDATCPIVRRIQKLVARLARGGAEIVIVGNRRHPEIQGLLGYSRGKARVVENETQARALPFRKRRAVLAQSTQDLELFERVAARLVDKTATLTVYNTICSSAQTRQKATAKLAGRVDTLFIVGGRNSSNTNKLYEISKRVLPNTHFIETAAEITAAMLARSRRVGISGGASTPPEAIHQTVDTVKRCLERKTHEEIGVQCQT
jgi:4-hydroxy-3-methylbut-2-enyl diphosphate reductase